MCDISTASAQLRVDYYTSVELHCINATQTAAKSRTKDQHALIETDSPWLAPVPYRGKPNQPGFVREVGEFIAELKGISVDELASVTTENFCKLFGIVKQ